MTSTSRLIQAVDSGLTVVVPNTELAASLTDAVERSHQASGREIWPTPRIRDFGGWLKDRHVRRQLIDSTLPRCLSDVEERELWRDAVLGSDLGQRFLEPAGAARAARRARRATHEYAIPMDAVGAEGGEEALIFVEWSARFAQRCRDLGCIGADDLLGSAIEEGGAGAASDPDSGPGVVWIESSLWRPVARGWLERHAGVPLAPIRAPRRMEHALAQVRRAESPAAELASIAEWARGHLALRDDFRAWICVPDLAQRRSELVDAFDAALAPSRFALHDGEGGAPYAVAGGTPLADYAPVRSALELLSAADGRVAFARFSALLRSPELSESAFESSAAACLDVALRSSAPAEATLLDWLRLAQTVGRSGKLRPVAALTRIAAALQPLAQLKGSHPMSRWLSVWITAFESAPWCFRHRWSSGEYQSAERFRELLATLALGDSSFGSQTRTSAESILRRAARDTQFQVQTGVPPISVSGQWIDPWLAYDGLWVASCDEAHWPPPVEPVPLLPVRLQRQHGVIAAAMESQLRFAEDLQRRWLERASRCAFSCADGEEGRRAAPSPLLQASFAESGAVDGAVSIGLEPAPTHPHWRAQLGRAPIIERLDDEWAPAFGEGERTRGVSTLKAQSRCAFRGFAETRLRAEPLENPVPGFNDRERGELVHDSLHQIWSALGGSAGLAERLARPQELSQLITESAVRAIARLCARRDPGRRWSERERERLLKLLGRWLELESRRAPFEIERLEAGSEIARHAGLDFSVRIDRIDRLPDGSRALIDYKTGAAGRDWQNDRPDNPQLPIYALLHQRSLIAVAYGRINAAECTFVAEAERAGVFFPGRRATRMEGMGTLAELMELWSERLDRLAHEFREGRAAVDPLPTACRSCHLHGLCRVPSTLDLSDALDEPAEDA